MQYSLIAQAVTEMPFRDIVAKCCPKLPFRSEKTKFVSDCELFCMEGTTFHNPLRNLETRRIVKHVDNY